MVTFKYAPMFQLGEDKTEYYLLTKDYVSVGEFEGIPVLKVEKEGLTAMANAAFRDVSFMLRPAHNEQVAKILSDPEASANDRYVALTFLRNAEVACKGRLPFCQDTGTAIIHGEKGQQVWTGYCDEEALSEGVFKTYTEENLRYSQNAPLTMYDEVNKLFLTGHAQATFKVLTALGLFTHLFSISPMLLNSSVCRSFLDHAFASTDQRFKENKCNKPHFLYAIVLWNEFIWNFYQQRDELLLSADDINYKDLISYLASKVVIQQYQITAMPEQIINSIALLWRLQFLLETKEPEKYVRETTSYHAFRAAFDLFKLRAEFDPNLRSRVDFWQPHYDRCKAESERRRLNDQNRQPERRSNGNEGSNSRRSRPERRDRSRGFGNSAPRRDGAGDQERAQNFEENAASRQKRINKARSWRQAMNLEP